MDQTTVQPTPEPLPINALWKQARWFKISGMLLLLLAAPLTNVFLTMVVSLAVLNTKCELARLGGTAVEEPLEGKRGRMNGEWVRWAAMSGPPAAVVLLLAVGQLRLWPATRWPTAVLTALAAGVIVGLVIYYFARIRPPSEGFSLRAEEIVSAGLIFSLLLVLLAIHGLNLRRGSDRLFTRSVRKALRAEAPLRHARRSSRARIALLTAIVLLLALHLAIPCITGLVAPFLDVKNYAPEPPLGLRDRAPALFVERARS